MREWFIRLVLKTSVSQGTEGSNPSPSAKLEAASAVFNFVEGEGVAFEKSVTRFEA